jgi:predicted RNA-binding protein YlqC (UPF0109 family)
MEETMDDLKKKGADDRTKINMNEAWEVDFWTHELAVSKDELQKVIDKVGNSADAWLLPMRPFNTPQRA